MLSFQNDDWMIQYREGNPIWIATLNDSTTVFRDDGRWPNEEWSAWIRLKKYCRETGLYIKSFRFGFRSNMFNLQDDAEGYSFILGIRGNYGSSTPMHFWKVGVVEDENVNLRKWYVPEMMPKELEVRKLEDCLEYTILKG